MNLSVLSDLGYNRRRNNRLLCEEVHSFTIIYLGYCPLLETQTVPCSRDEVTPKSS